MENVCNSFLVLGCFMGLFLQCGGLTKPTFDSPGHITLTVREYSPVILPCSVQNLGPYEVIWKDNRRKILLTFEEENLAGEILFGLDRPRENYWNLRIKRAEISHTGNYTCQVTTSPIMSKTVTLKVLGTYRRGKKVEPEASKLRFGVSWDTVTVVEGNNATLPCFVQNLGGNMASHTGETHRHSSSGMDWNDHSFQSFPLEILEWMIIPDHSRAGMVVLWADYSLNKQLIHGGRSVDDRYSKGRSYAVDQSLHIRGVRQTDEGKYKCQVTTDPPISQIVTLRVIKKGPFPPEVDVKPKFMKVYIGSDAILSCSVQHLGEYKVIWTDVLYNVLTVGDRRITSDERVIIERPTLNQWNLHIRNVTASNTRAYYCLVASSPVRMKTVELVTLDKMWALKQDIAETIRCRKNPGLAVTVVKDGSIVLAEGFGMADINKDIAVTNRTLFGIASLSKAFAATLLLKLISRRTDINLDTKVVDILGDDFGFSDEFRTKHTTLEDILSHRTGLPGNNAIRFDTNLTRENLPRRIKHLKATGTFRGSYIYNNLMYGVVTRVAEVLGGASWEELVRRELYDPLQMRSSDFATKMNLSSDQVAKPYKIKDGNVRPVNLDFSRRWALLCGSGCIMTNAIDAGNWMNFHLSHGLSPSGQRVMEEEDIKQLYVNRTVMPNYLLKYFTQPDVPVTTGFDRYALGWRVGNYKGYKMIVHSGATFGYRALLALLPSVNLGIFIAMSGDDPNFEYRFTLQNYIADVVLDEEPWLNVSTICSFPKPWFEPEISFSKYNVSKSLSEHHDKYEGVYHNTPYGNLEIFYNETEGQLMAKYGFARFRLYQQKGDNFYGEPFGINDIKDCSLMTFKKRVGSDMYIDIEAAGFESKSPPIFVRSGHSSSTSRARLVAGSQLMLYFSLTTIFYILSIIGSQ